MPGDACRLVVIDRIPFPRPDDPLTTARQEAVARVGGNAFMTVVATQAALLLAQGVGRLVRSSTDRGVVAVLDSRLATARYAPFLRASLPPFWSTSDRDVVVRGALRRLKASARHRDGRRSGDDAGRLLQRVQNRADRWNPGQVTGGQCRHRAGRGRR